ncbi:putative Chitin binding Peritrophin-A domain-containing protein 23, partial [Homarus americanus]
VGAGQDFECPSPDGQFATDQSCRIFYQCVGNFAFRRQCPEGSLYDGSKHNCESVHDPTVKCGPQPIVETTPAPPDPFKASPCDPIECLLPYCHCSFEGKEIPGRLKPETTPQMIMMTFDGAINDLNFNTYSEIFLDNRTNPNGCPIRSTFFVAHEYTNYQLVEDFYSRGHEIAVGTVSRRAGLEDEGEDTWIGETVTMKEILQNFAGIRAVDIKGVLSAYGFTWDSTINNPPSTEAVWPYSLEYAIPHECRAGTCPTRSFPGIWEMPMNSHFRDFHYQGGFCPYLDQCALSYQNEPDVLEWLVQDFNRHYLANRAPYMMSLTTNWFQTPELKNAIHAFIDYTMQFEDVYYTTVTEALQWVTTPQKLNDIPRFQPWDCKQKFLPDPPCPNPKSCKLSLTPKFDNRTTAPHGSRYMVTCYTCPTVYPWVWDATGLGFDKDTYLQYSNDQADLADLDSTTA